MPNNFNNYLMPDDKRKAEELLASLENAAQTSPVDEVLKSTTATRVPAEKTAKPPSASLSDSDVVKDYISNQPQLPSYDDFVGAQKQSRENLNNANLGEGLSDIAYGLSGAKGRAPSFDSLRQSANQPTQQIADQFKFGAQAQQLDPNSPRAVVAKKVLQTLGAKAGDLEGATLSDIPMLEKIYGTKATLDTKNQVAQMMGQYRNDNLNFRDSQLQDRNDFRAHQAAINRIKTDKTLNDSVVKAQNLTNTINNIESTGQITTQDMADVQSLAISNMGIGGTSSVHERAKRYADSLGMRTAEVEQFLTGKPVSIGTDNPLFGRYKQIMQLEVQNFRDRAEKAFNAKASGNKSIYERRPDLAADVEDLRSQYFGQFPKGNEARAPKSNLAPGTLEDGYKFMGGEPGDRKNWVKQ